MLIFAPFCTFLHPIAPAVIPPCDTKSRVTHMKKPASTRFVFDRKKTASKKTTGLIQVEVLFQRRRKFISTGVKVYSDQWNDKVYITRRSDMMTLNERIESVKNNVDIYINKVTENGEAFTFEGLEAWLEIGKEKARTFVEWVEERIESRQDIRESSRHAQRKLVGSLRDFGLIVTFSDVTKANIMRYDDYLRSRGLKQTTVWSYHKTLKTYINDAITHELLEHNPYASLKLDHGRSEWGRYLSAEDVERIERAVMPTESIAHVRDLFLVQCYTGLSYSDLMSVDFRQTEVVDGVTMLSNQRNKTGVLYTTVLLPKTLDILERYGYELPRMSNTQYNLRLKVVADAAGIDKPIASHYGRRTCGMLLLNEGFPIEVVSRVLGHTSIRTTQECYARILDRTVARAFSERARKSR